MAILNPLRFVTTISLLCCGMLPALAAAQANRSQVDAELQIYPAGLIVTVGAALGKSRHAQWRLHAGVNVTDRRDFGEHDEEQGEGPGLGVQYLRRLGPRDASTWVYGVRADVWWLNIDWEDRGGALPRRGKTDVTVFQPTLVGGYEWMYRQNQSLFLTVSAGAEMNIDTDGEDVGEGAIGLLGLRYAY